MTMARGYRDVFLLIYAFAMLASVHSTFPKPTISTEHQAEVVNATCRIPDSWTRTTRWTKDVNVRELRIFQCRSSEPKAKCANVTLASWKISDTKNCLPYEGEVASGAMVRMWRSGPWPAMNRGNVQDPVLSVLTPRSEYGTFYCAIRYFNDTEEGAAMEDNAIVDLTLRQDEMEQSSLYPHPRFQLEAVRAHALTVTWTASGQSDGEEVRVTRALASEERAGEGKVLLLADQGHIEWDKSEEVLLANVERLKLTLYTRDRGIPFAYGCHVHSPACVGDKRDLCRCGRYADHVTQEQVSSTTKATVSETQCEDCKCESFNVCLGFLLFFAVFSVTLSVFLIYMHCKNRIYWPWKKLCSQSLVRREKIEEEVDRRVEERLVKERQSMQNEKREIKRNADAEIQRKEGECKKRIITEVTKLDEDRKRMEVELRKSLDEENKNMVADFDARVFEEDGKKLEEERKKRGEGMSSNYKDGRPMAKKSKVEVEGESEIEGPIYNKPPLDEMRVNLYHNRGKEDGEVVAYSAKEENDEALDPLLGKQAGACTSSPSSPRGKNGGMRQRKKSRTQSGSQEYDANTDNTKYQDNPGQTETKQPLRNISGGKHEATFQGAAASDLESDAGGQ